MAGCPTIMGWSAGTVRVERFASASAVTITRPRGRPGWLGMLLLLLLAPLAGCKSREGSLGRGSDPLVYGPDRIPRQNVPLPDRGAVGQGQTDPLIAAPTGRTGARDSSGGGYNDDPARFRGVHIPSPATTPAGLAGRWDDEGLKISDGPPERVPLRPAADSAPAGPSPPAPAPASNPPPQPDSIPTTGPPLQELYQELERLGVPRDSFAIQREGSQYLFRATLPWDGARRQYTGLGSTPAEAVRQVLEQIRLDRASR
jgi:hypothetical protein